MRQQIAELIGLVTKAGQENRPATTEELARIADLGELVTKALPGNHDEERRRPFLSIITKAEETGHLVTKGERLTDRYAGLFDEDCKKLSLARMLRGYVTGDWRGADLERKALAESPSAGGMVVPVVVATQVIDRARQQGVIFQAGASTLPMTSSTMPIPRITGDASIDWYGQNEEITESDPVMDAFPLTAKKAAALVRVSNELLEDAPGAEEALMNMLAGAMAAELDSQALTGPIAVPQLNPIGLAYQTGVTEIAAVGAVTNYAKWIEGYYNTIAAGLTPTAIIHSIPVARRLASLATGLSGDLTPLAAPPEYANLPKYAAAALGNVGVSIVGDWTKLIVGIRVEVMIEASRESEGFKTDSTMLRMRWRGDVAPMYPAAFTRLMGITTT